MKQLFLLLAFCSISTIGFTQGSKTVTSCKIYLDGKVVENSSLETILEWCKLVPPTVQCDDGMVYQLETFNVSFISLNPFMTTDFGIGQKGVPIRAVQAVEKGKSGDAMVLKNVKYIDSAGAEGELPVISIKIE